MTERVRVTLRAILEGMELPSEEFAAYLHRPTGRVIVVGEEALPAAEEGLADEEAGVDDEELADAKAIAAGGDDYVPLPDRFDIDEYRMMESFALSQGDPEARQRLLRAIRGTGAFRYFKDTVRDLGIRAEWYAWRARGFEDVARAWAEGHGIELLPEAPDG